MLKLSGVMNEEFGFSELFAFFADFALFMLWLALLPFSHIFQFFGLFRSQSALPHPKNLPTRSSGKWTRTSTAGYQ